MAQYPAPGSSPKLLATKQNVAGAKVLGSGDSASGAWAQVTASTTSDILITGLAAVGPTNSTTAGLIYIGIGIGGAGSETTVGEAYIAGGTMASSNWTPGGYHPLPVPIRVASGTRVAVKAVLGSDTVTVYVLSVPYANVEGN